MNSQAVGYIDTSQMQILTEFPTTEEIHNIVKFRIGVVGNQAAIVAVSKAGDVSVQLIFERNNVHRVVNLLNDVIRGKIAQSDKNYSTFKAGEDLIGIGEHAPRGTLMISFYNNRRAKIDEHEETGFSIYTDPDTLLRIKVELERLVEQGKI